MNKIVITLMGLIFAATGCMTYSQDQVALTEPDDQSYCQRIGDMAVGIEPYMKKDKSVLVFDNDLWTEQVLALNISMFTDGDGTYIVNREDIEAVDEFGMNYHPMSANETAYHVQRLLRFRKDRLYSNIADWELPDTVTVTGELAQGFVYFDMKPNEAKSRRFTVYVHAVADAGEDDKMFSITVDPMRMHMNPTERWSSYYGGVTPCGDLAMAETTPEPDDDSLIRAEDAAARAEEAAARAENAAKKQERAFEKQLEK